MKLPLNSSGHPSVRHLSSPSHHPSIESLTLQLFAQVGVVVLKSAVELMTC